MAKTWIEMNSVFEKDTREECNRARFDVKSSVDAQIIKQSQIVDIMLEIQKSEAASGKPSLLDSNGRKSAESVEAEMARLRSMAERIYAERIQQSLSQPEL
ncbi:MAG: hypothetical protein IJ542_04280 [Clostridia bacterium]|nr:hypothetical protein [Clostridia bacterium]